MWNLSRAYIKIMCQNSDIRLAIIIPVYNEEQNIDKFMHHISTFKTEAEIVFVDGGSQDKTVEKIRPRFKVLQLDTPSRAKQMNLGIREVDSDAYLFLHADTFLDENAVDTIKSELKSGTKAACFKLCFNTTSFSMKIVAFFSSMRVLFRNIAFGDQGILIRKKELYALGLYKEIPIMEDYQLSIDLKKAGIRIKLLDKKITTSARRFKKNGVWKTVIQMQKLQSMYRNGKSIEDIRQLYK